MEDIATVEIVLGTYEEYLLGYKLFKSLELTQSFTTHSHSSSIRSVAVSHNLLASGGADDRILIYDLALRKEHCMLTHHNATVNCLKFTPDNTHLISGSADGVLAIVRVGNWQLEKLWEKPHKGHAILDIAIHPSGKLALTLGSDCSLRTWNLVKGRQAFVVNLNSKSKDAKSLDHIRWAQDGARFVLAGGKYTEIWSIDKGGILQSVEHSNKVTSCIWIAENLLVVGYENGELGIVHTESGELHTFSGHENRVKGIELHDDKIVTASSSGDIKIWDKKLKQLSHASTGCRITCLCLAVPLHKKEKTNKTKTNEEYNVPPKKKKKRKME